MIIKTATGKEFESDSVTKSSNPERLYIFLQNTTIWEAAFAFSNPEELPIEGYEEFSQFSTIIANEETIQIILKPAEVIK